MWEGEEWVWVPPFPQPFTGIFQFQVAVGAALVSQEQTPYLCPQPALHSQRSSSFSLQKIQQLSEGSMFGHGLKHLFHSRRRSREREHPSSQDPQQQQQGMSDHESPDEKERSPEMHRVSYAMSLHDLPARPTAFNRVLQQIRARPSIKRGASLHGGGGGGSRRAKSSSLEPQRGSPHLLRKTPQDSGLAAILHQHQGRPRSSSTTDTALLLPDGGSLLAEEAEGLGDKVRLAFRAGAAVQGASGLEDLSWGLAWWVRHTASGELSVSWKEPERGPSQKQGASPPKPIFVCLGI